MSHATPPVVLDLFAGTGVGVAIKELGGSELGVEIMPAALASRATNDMTTAFNDVWDAEEFQHIWDEWSEWTRNHFTLWGSPPCQAFSMSGAGAGRKALDQVLGIIERKQYLDMTELREQSDLLGDERIGLVLSPLYYAARWLPMYIALEQVPPVLPVWEAMAVELRELGYSVWTGNLQTEQFGVPQTRKRAILMARRDGVEVSPPAPTHSKFYSHAPQKLDEGVAKWVSMADALGWGMTERPSMTVTGGGTSAGGAEPFGNASRKGMLREYDANRWMRKPDTSGAPSLRITTAEAALLQSYPADFTFSGNQGNQFQQIGNAVPPQFAKAILSQLWRS